jgi:NAD+ kinase
MTPDLAPPAPDRAMVMITHAGREAAVRVARSLLDAFRDSGVTVWLPADEAQRVCREPDQAHTFAPEEYPPQPCELVVVVGGDGTILRAAELALAIDAPLVGVNLGHVGFLAEVEPENVHDLAAALVNREWVSEERTILDVSVHLAGRELWQTWALNEASVEKLARERMISVLLEIDHQPLSEWSCDGVICGTPTGSTAYAWSAGGPVVWPDVEAMVVVPLSAHALFARPLVVSPESHIAIDLASSNAGAVVWCDGRRSASAPPGSRIEVTTSPQRLRFARVHSRPFTHRLVAKFDLPVGGWREEPPAS